MRLLLPVALLAAVLVLPATAQMDFGQSYQVRAAVGDIPSTPAIEPAGTLNVEQRLAVATTGSAKDLHFSLPAGSSLDAVSCSCGHVAQQAQPGGVTVTVPANATGTATVTVLSSQPFSTAAAFSLRAPPEAGPDAAVILFVPKGSAFEAPGTPSSPGSSTDGTSTIEAFTFTASSPLPSPFWAVFHPGTVAAQPVAPAPAGFPWLQAGVAFALGIALWAFLVQRGVVQSRSRKQVAQVAAHAEIAAQDPPAVLEGKKRALLAALKEVEMARQAQEMDTATYDAVKAEFKKQAVTVMRALDEGTGKA
jgi:hypothetical protein